MSGQYLFMYDRGTDNEADIVPIAFGTTRVEAMKNGMARLLHCAAGDGPFAMRYGSGEVVSQPGLTAAQFADLANIIEAFWANTGGDA